jgi:RimJ/RimL family protein N-acetyltransferase
VTPPRAHVVMKHTKPSTVPRAAGPAAAGRVAIPTLTTERLVLRAFGLDDLDAYAAMTADPVTMRYLGEGKPLDRAGTWRVIAIILGHWDLCGYGIWAMVERATGRLIGRAGLYRPEGWPGLEAVWSVARERWGQGYATEAGRAVLGYAFEVVGAEHVISAIHPLNAASIRVAEKLGEAFEYATSIEGRERAVYGLSRQKWRSLTNAPEPG